MTELCTPIDRFLLAAASLALGGLGALTLASTPIGQIDEGWSDGSYQRAYEERFETTMPTARGASELLAALKLTLLGEVSEGAVLGQNGWLFTAEEFRPAVAPRPLGSELERVRSALAANDIALLPVVVPDKARTMAHQLPRGRSAAFEARYDAALRTIDQAGLPVIDLRPQLATLDKPFLRTDTHWSPSGADAAADAIADEVRALGLDLTVASTNQEMTGTVTVEGDLLAFADSGAWAGQAAIPREEIQTFETQVTTTGGLFGDSPVEIILVGTSFSARADLHFEGFLKHHLGADVLNLAEVGKGPFVPMDRTLADLSALPSAPRLVIWEIPERYLALPEPIQPNTL